MIDLLTRLDALRNHLRAERDAMLDVEDPDQRAEGIRRLDEHLAAVDDACEALQVN